MLTPQVNTEVSAWILAQVPLPQGCDLPALSGRLQIQEPAVSQDPLVLIFPSENHCCLGRNEGHGVVASP